ncbi:hypothetical protein C8Q73DRAFT_663014 [Cubamyces lactineus]|nr:hypothetical protein C8Q73DRAFT_663014 [Cubamyces lactineus]
MSTSSLHHTAEYTPLVTDADDVKAHLVDAEWAEHDDARRKSGSSNIFNARMGVAVLLLINLLLWAYAALRLEGAAVFLGELVEAEYGPARNLPLPDPLDGLGEFLAMRESQAARASAGG